MDPVMTDTEVNTAESPEVYPSERNAVAREAAKQRASSFVMNISSEVKLSLAARRDELDNLEARVVTSEKALVHYITQFVEFTGQLMESSERIRKEVQDAGLPFAGTPPATLTQGGGK